MEYDNLSTEELLRIASETNTINPESTPEIIADYQNGNIVQQILSIMSEMGLTRKELAKRIGKSKQYVSRILNEKQNFTISSLAVFATALHCDLSINLTQREKELKETTKVENKKFWEFVSSNLLKNTDSSYHELFSSTICCQNYENNEEYKEDRTEGKVNNGNEYKIS